MKIDSLLVVYSFGASCGSHGCSSFRMAAPLDPSFVVGLLCGGKIPGDGFPPPSLRGRDLKPICTLTGASSKWLVCCQVRTSGLSTGISAPCSCSWLDSGPGLLCSSFSALCSWEPWMFSRTEIAMPSIIAGGYLDRELDHPTDWSSLVPMQNTVPVVQVQVCCNCCSFAHHLTKSALVKVDLS